MNPEHFRAGRVGGGSPERGSSGPWDSAESDPNGREDPWGGGDWLGTMPIWRRHTGVGFGGRSVFDWGWRRLVLVNN